MPPCSIDSPAPRPQPQVPPALPWETLDDELQSRVQHYFQIMALRAQPDAPLALLADNGKDWIAVDLATHKSGAALVPLPAFFTAAQWQHALEAAGVQALFCASEGVARALGFDRRVGPHGPLSLFERATPSICRLAGIQKVTFTSGTTSQPKGVCLTSARQWEVASVLRQQLSGLEIRRHLNLLPLPVLLENIAGAYTALLTGAANIALPLAQVGLTGAAHFDAVTCLDTIARERAESIILLPQMLRELVAVARSHDRRLRTLKFAAVGGARTSAELLLAARAKGIPVYEGYGLSECGSVVSLNLPGRDRPGTAGRPLPNRDVRIGERGEIEVRGGAMAGYLGSTARPGDWMSTGDLGYLDKDGFLHVSGRADNVLVTAFGRNVSPEWPESALLGTGPVAQAVVFGDARPYLVAAIVPASAGATDEDIEAAVARANSGLPDFARVRGWFRAAPFTHQDGTATINGRARRQQIAQRYRAIIQDAYRNEGGANAVL